MDSRSATVLVAALAVVTMVGMAAAANLMVGPSRIRTAPRWPTNVRPPG